MVNSDLNCCICLKIKKYLMSLPHLPTSANFHQDIILHIQEVHQWRVRLMHSLILVWFLSSFQLPNSQCGAYSQQRCKNQKHFNQFTMSLLFCVILFYIIFLVSASLRSVQSGHPLDVLHPCICPYQSS